MTVPTVSPTAPELHQDVVTERAVRGLVLLVGRTVPLQLVTLGATVALARLVAPAEYGLFAIALTVQQLARTAVEVGLPAALVQRAAPMSPHEERVVTGSVVAAGTAFVAVVLPVVFAVLPALGVPSRAAEIAAVAMIAIPFYGARIVPTILLERRLHFGRVIVIESVETLTFYGFALPAAVAGGGAFSLAGAIPCSAVIGTALAWIVQPWSRGLALDLATIRPLGSFGLRISAAAPLQLAREFVLTALLAALGRPALAGFYNLSVRLMSSLTAISYAVQRVAFASLARLDGAEARAARAGRAAALTAVAASLPVAVIAGAGQPLVAVAFGPRWLPAATVLATASPGVLLFTSFGAVLMSLSLAEGDAGRPLRALAAYGAMTVGVGAATASWLGELGAGLASLSGAVVFCVAMARSANPAALSGLRTVVAATVVAAGATLCGRLATSATDGTALIEAVFAAWAAWTLLALALMPRDLRQLARLARSAVARDRSR